jgi:hypothetical protein
MNWDYLFLDRFIFSAIGFSQKNLLRCLGKKLWRPKNLTVKAWEWDDFVEVCQSNKWFLEAIEVKFCTLLWYSLSWKENSCQICNILGISLDNLLWYIRVLFPVFDVVEFTLNIFRWSIKHFNLLDITKRLLSGPLNEQALRKWLLLW